MLRHMASIVLLAAYLPMVVLSSLHIHHETVDFHDDCTQCVGHFEAQHHHECDCQYCQFLSLGYFGQDGGQPSLFSTAVDVCHGGKTEGAEMLQAGTSRLRAPPVHYCYSFVA